MSEVHVNLAAETLFNIGPLPITNTILTTWVVTILLIAFAYFATKKVSLIPHGIQNVAEIAVDSFQDLVSSVAGNKTKIFLPIVASFFFFILFGNYLGLLPGFGSIGFYEIEHGKEVFVPFLRSINSDLNTTVALAIVSLIATHYLSIRYLGLNGYIGKFLSLNPIFLFVGILEIIGEATKILSLSFRLFGNIFAGEVLLTTATTKLFAYIIPIPFYFLELLVGFVQALIFAILTLVFMVILTQKSNH
ncbi:ATP synthase F0 subunit A [Candidatus Curtissbacteria bacterium RBG_13_35_7]|uniref:ATP synthase subunit a n=1 Tax=Candidatus Curtissbacteria bacterium RBG_13_35_7 TaxID=1797705 RepID=A0A1F5G165_9BACT|nr:MAG: ATP synthase F0 subunit A [Candidatus Curtissbacteria bacterium RBG_13_35_7]